MTSTFALLHDPVKFIGCVMASYLEQKFELKHSILHSEPCEKKNLNSYNQKNWNFRVFISTKFHNCLILGLEYEIYIVHDRTGRIWGGRIRILEFFDLTIDFLAGNVLGIWICGCRCILESPGSQNQRVHIVLYDSKSAGAKGDVPKICGFVHPLHPLWRIPCKA